MSCPACLSSAVATTVPKMVDDRFGCPDVVDIIRCRDCHHHFVDPLRPDNELGALYEAYYGRIVPTNTHRYSRLRATLLRETLPGQDFLGAAVGKSLLDVGCGSGDFLIQARALGFEATGIDVDPTAIDAARALGFVAHRGAANIDTLQGARFDVITLNQVIEHVEDPRGTLASLREKLSDSGILFVATPNGRSASLQRTGRNWINWHVPYHQHIFSPESLRISADASGLRLIRMSTRTPVIWSLLQQQHTLEPITPGLERWPWRGQPTVRRPRGSDTKDRVVAIARAGMSWFDDLRGNGDCIMATFRRS